MSQEQLLSVMMDAEMQMAEREARREQRVRLLERRVSLKEVELEAARKGKDKRRIFGKVFKKNEDPEKQAAMAELEILRQNEALLREQKEHDDAQLRLLQEDCNRFKMELHARHGAAAVLRSSLPPGPMGRPRGFSLAVEAGGGMGALGQYQIGNVTEESAGDLEYTRTRKSTVEIYPVADSQMS
jgi:hypothetical protein